MSSVGRDKAEEWISESDDMTTESCPKMNKEKTKKKKKEQSVPELPDNYKQCNTQVVGIPDEAETEEGA